MMKDFTIEKLLDLKETMAAELFEGKTYPWEVLPEIKDFILKLGKHWIRMSTSTGRAISGLQNLQRSLLLPALTGLRSSVRIQRFVTARLSGEMPL